MNTDEATTVLGILVSAWPNHELHETTAEIWRAFLDNIDADDGMTAAYGVIAREKWFPSIATFKEAAEAVEHARRNRDAATRGLPRHDDGVIGPERWETVKERVWDALALRGTTKHKNCASGECPVCPPFKRCPTCGTTHHPPVRQGKAEIIDLQARLAERRRRFEEVQ